MGKGNGKAIKRVLAALAILMWATVATAMAADSPKQPDAAKTLENAFDQAKQTGKPVVVDVGPEDPATVQVGDLVAVNYTATLEDGSVLATTRKTVAEDKGRKKAEVFQQPASFAPEEVLAGRSGRVPGMAEAVVGMAKGGKTTVTVPAEKAFGPHDPQKVTQFPCERRMPKKPMLKPQTWMGQFGKFPVVGKEVDLTPYFKSKVVEVGEDFVQLESLAKGGETGDEPFGKVAVRLEGEEIVIHLDPTVGALFEMDDQKGKITASDGTTFTVDFNPPLAGKSVKLDLEVVSLTKASAFKQMAVAWNQDHDKALEKAKAQGKPTVVMLYAAWCSWSNKLIDESFEDPRVKTLKDRFVWVKVNSDENREFYDAYEQKGFPLVVVLDAKGEVVKKIDGYKDGGGLAAELKSVLN